MGSTLNYDEKRKFVPREAFLWAYWFWPVRPSATLFGSWETQQQLKLGSLHFICGMYMKNKWTRIISLRQSCRSGVVPLL